MSTKKVTLIDRLADNNWTPFIIALIVFLIWSGGTYLLYDHYYRERPDWAGQFGDMFGAANSLFSGLAFAGLVYTIILQRKELNLTRRELNLTRREFKQQNQTMIQQRFENTFFNMLKLHNDSTETLKIDYVLFDRRAQALGKEGFHAIYDKLRLAKGVDERKVHSFILNTYQFEVYKEHHDQIDIYFRSLFQIMRLIDESDRSINKMSYSGIVRAYLTDYELILIFYNCLTSNGNQFFKPLIEKYALLKNLNKRWLLAEVNPSEDYNQTAYGFYNTGLAL